MHDTGTSNFFQVVICRKQPGATHEQVARLSEALQGWAERQPGFVRRRLVRCEDAYVDIVEWSDAGAAQAAARAPGHPDAAEMGRVLALDGMTLHQGAALP